MSSKQASLVTEKDRVAHQQKARSVWASKSSIEISEHIDSLLTTIVSKETGALERELCEIEALLCSNILSRRYS